MDLFTYLMAKNDHNTSVNKDLFSYLLGKGQSGTYQAFTGTSISANNTKKAKMKLTLKGNTSQTGTPTPSTPIPVNVVSGDNEVVVCGKNLLGLTDGTYSNNGITAIVNNGEITLNGTATGGASVIVIELINVIASSLGTLTKSLNPTGTYTGVQTSLRGSDKSMVGLYTDDASNRSETLTRDAYYLRIQVSENVSVNCTLKAQVELGSTATTYEPYNGDTYELSLGDIKMRGIGADEDYFVRNSGKNLFDKNNANILNANLNNDKITFSNPERTFWIECKPNTTYTIQKLVNSPFSRFTIADTPTEPQYGDSVYNLDGDAVATSLVHTTGANAKYMVCWFYNTSSTNYTMQEVLDSIMINEGSVALPYEPYGTGQWCKYNAIREVVLDGETDGLKFTSAEISRNKRFSLILSDVLKQSYLLNVESKSNNFIYNTDVYRDGGDTIGFIINSTQLYVRFGSTSELDTITKANAWLSTHNTQVDYILASPYLSLIENETLISQLDKVEKAMSKQGQTNISQVNNDLAFEIEAEIKVGS